MRTLITGKVVDFVPTFGAHPDGKCLVLSEDGDFAITVDTGFNGGIAIPLEMMDKMDMEFFGYDTFTLATGITSPCTLAIMHTAAGNIEL